MAKIKSFEGDILNAIYDHNLTNTREIAEFVGSSMSTAYRWLARFRDKDIIKSEKTEGSWDYEPLDESFEDVQLTFKMKYDSKRRSDLETEITIEGRVRTGLTDGEIMTILADKSKDQIFAGLLSVGTKTTTTRKDGSTFSYNNMEHLSNDSIFEDGSRELVTGVERGAKHNRSKESTKVEGQFRSKSGVSRF